MPYVLDTNAISDILKRDTIVRTRMETAILGGEQVKVNGLSYYEVKRGLLDAGAPDTIHRLERFCKRFSMLFLDTQNLFDRAAQIHADLKGQGLPLKDADILIASCAMEHRHVLVTNDPDFDRIDGLEVEDWRN